MMLYVVLYHTLCLGYTNNNWYTTYHLILNSFQRLDQSIVWMCIPGMWVMDILRCNQH